MTEDRKQQLDARQLERATRHALAFAGDMMQQLGWARQQGELLARELDDDERNAYRLFDQCWDALQMGPVKPAHIGKNMEHGLPIEADEPVAGPCPYCGAHGEVAPGEGVVWLCGTHQIGKYQPVRTNECIAAVEYQIERGIRKERLKASGIQPVSHDDPRCSCKGMETFRALRPGCHADYCNAVTQHHKERFTPCCEHCRKSCNGEHVHPCGWTGCPPRHERFGVRECQVCAHQWPARAKVDTDPCPHCEASKKAHTQMPREDGLGAHPSTISKEAQ